MSVSNSLRSPLGELQRWIVRERGLGGVVTADALWHRIRKKYQYLDEHDQEALFQAAGERL